MSKEPSCVIDESTLLVKVAFMASGLIRYLCTMFSSGRYALH